MVAQTALFLQTLYAMTWRGHRHAVDEVHLVHERREGAVRHLIYSLTAGGTLLQLRFDSEHARWYVDGVFIEEG